ncbi:hypothetical protein I4U23_025637 [Adineta vaga]|nr:hypothetical protein I4U23_025637 [Adineta vaga]
MMKESYFILVITVIVLLIAAIKAARIPLAGSFISYENETKSQIIDNIPANALLPSLDSIHDNIHHSPKSNDTLSASNHTKTKQSGPSLDLIDPHAHSHDDDNTSAIETAKRFLIQPSLEFLDAQLHAGNEHVHDKKNETNHRAADLNDFQNWLKEQNQTGQLNRFLLLQKEIKNLDSDDAQMLNEKLNRTIEELKSEWKRKQRRKFDL